MLLVGVIVTTLSNGIQLYMLFVDRSYSRSRVENVSQLYPKLQFIADRHNKTWPVK
jgi:hypothetical protein